MTFGFDVKVNDVIRFAHSPRVSISGQPTHRLGRVLKLIDKNHILLELREYSGNKWSFCINTNASEIYEVLEMDEIQFRLMNN